MRDQVKRQGKNMGISKSPILCETRELFDVYIYREEYEAILGLSVMSALLYDY